MYTNTYAAECVMCQEIQRKHNLRIQGIFLVWQRHSVRSNMLYLTGWMGFWQLENEIKNIALWPWSRKCQPTEVFLPGKFHGQRSLVGYSPWGGSQGVRCNEVQAHTPFYKTCFKSFPQYLSSQIWLPPWPRHSAFALFIWLFISIKFFFVLPGCKLEILEAV